MANYFGDNSWVQLEKAIKEKSVIILPIGTTEEHGRHLPVRTDAAIAEYFGRRLGDACIAAGIPALVMETIQYGFSMSAVRRWPGCPCIGSRHFTDYIFDMVDALVQMGFEKIVMLDCHGNHDCLLRLVMREIADKHNTYIMTLSPMSLSAGTYNAIKRDPQGDIHGGEWETSAMLHIAPDLVDMNEATDIDSIRCNTPLRGPVSAWGLQNTKTGLFGNPVHATAELGKTTLDAATEAGLNMIRLYREHNEKTGD